MAIIRKQTIAIPEIVPFYSSGLEKTRLFVGLGNPGQQYQNNRHNIGFMCLNKFCDLHELTWITKKDFQVDLAQTNIAGSRIILIKPQTYMNLSGQAVSKVLQFYKLSLEETYIIYDEIRLKLGLIEILKTNKDYGHNGLKSLSQYLSNDLHLIRTGIGPKQPSNIDLTQFVLSDFTKSQIPIVNKIAQEISSLIGETSYMDLVDERITVF